MSKKIWTEEELRIVGGVFLEHPDTKISTCEEVAEKLKEAGFGDISVEKIKAQLGDFLSIHNKSKSNHSKRTEKIYNDLVGKVKRIMEGIGSHLFDIYAKECPILDYDVEVNIDNSNNISSSLGNLSNLDLVNCFVVPGVSKSGKTKSFVEYFLDLRIKSGKTDSEIYNPFKDGRGFQAFEGKKFNKITKGECITKRSLLAISILMELDYDTTVEFLAMANFGLSSSIKSDVIISYAIKHGIYDLYEINDTLYNYGCQILFFRG